MEDLSHLWYHRVADGPTAGFRKILVTEPEHPFAEHWWPRGHTLGWEHALVHQWVGLARAHAAGAPPAAPQATFADGWRADVVVHALAESAATQRAVPVNYGLSAASNPRQELAHARP
jgi:hypothetical protein